MNTPDITKAQVVAIVQAIIGVLAAFGAPITEAQSVALIALVAVVATVLVHGDAGIRRGRATIAAAQAATPTNPPVPGPDPADAVDPSVLDS